MAYLRWMIESLVIDPFDSDHWLYGTGATIQGGRDLTQWDTTGNISLSSLADGIEETSIQGLISPPSGPQLISAVGDIEGGFRRPEMIKEYSLLLQDSFTMTWKPLLQHTSLILCGLRPRILISLAMIPSCWLGLELLPMGKFAVFALGRCQTLLSSSKQVALSNDAGSTW